MPAKYIPWKKSFLPTKFYSHSHSHVIKIKGRYGQTYCTTYWEMNENWKLFIKKTFLLGKNWKFHFWPKYFHRVLLLMYGKSSDKNNANNCRERFLHTNKCNCMFVIPTALSQTETCFETDRTVWLPKRLCIQENFFTICIQLKLR